MLTKLRKIHLYVGWFVVLIFVLTGQYMRHVIYPAMEASDRFRFSIRGNHIYILLFGLMHLLLGAYFQPRPSVWRARLQQVGSGVLLLATGLVIVAFAFESKAGTDRPVVLSSLIVGITGVGLHLLAARKAE